ncbi:4-alpha-glucanotransferase [Pseudoalteromonas sp. DL2-H2.2]|uniref:4-alpha-glucanotransferase n=1 Tax=Pseudoalteromonas sp. DL2-H2.2 TaxID=2908889 RepID=UPI001F3AB282|nr:4-alpha-glucanotransferase [Pseudoalteromonas sp. DL2-H2.2]MCF2906836.1 4-alpha-glucanotransferase [Pseudoalteromonas sp. DL2-H2.2]
MQGLEQLFYLHGIGFDYTKYNGEHVYFDHATRVDALRCCGVDTDDESHIAELNFLLDVKPWLEVVDEVVLAEAETGCFSLKVPQTALHSSVVIQIPDLALSTSFALSQAEVCGDYHYNGQIYLDLKVSVGALPAGYFNAQIEGVFGTKTTELWSVPKRCYAIEQDDVKRTGLSLQLYTLRSERNAGMGDFRDLHQVISSAAITHCDFILLNPLHLLFESEPERASPYSPSHRCLINPLYIALDWAIDTLREDFQLSIDEALGSAQNECAQNYIDYSAVAKAKYAVLSQLFDKCEAVPAVRQALSEFKHDKEQTLSHSELTEREWFMQWLAHRQLGACQLHARQEGMAIGLINDLAVGCAQEGDEFTHNEALFAKGANVGAPPDPWAEAGQNWGLPALNPIKIKQHNYAYFRSLVRSNMASFGALRIDHVMAIRRLWWCFESQGKQDGCYIYYPFEHLLAILKIESHLNRAMVIGEDLGIVPPEVSAAMSDANLYGNILMYFAKDHLGQFKSVEQYRADTLLMVANHDVAPFSAWWCHTDISLKQDYQLCSEHEAKEMITAREEDKARLLTWLGLDGTHDAHQLRDAINIYAAIVKKLAASPSKLLAIQLDDLEQQQLPVNIPGTDREYPNWRRRLAIPAEQTLEQNSHLMKEIKRIREQA